MAALDLSKPAQQTKAPPGTQLIKRGEAVGSLVLVHQGEVAYLEPHSGRVLFRLGANSIPGFAHLLAKSPAAATIIASKESVVSVFPVNPGAPFSAMILGKLNVGMLGVRTIAQEILQAQQASKSLDELSALIQSTIDTLALVYSRLQPGMFQGDAPPTTGGTVVDPVLSAIRIVVERMKENNNDLPVSLNLAWLQAGHDDLLAREYAFDPTLDTEEFNFYRRLLALAPNIQGAMFQADLEILRLTGIRLSELLLDAMKDASQLLYGIDEGMEFLFRGENSFAEKFYVQADLFSSHSVNIPADEMFAILKFLDGRFTEILDNYRRVSGKAYEQVSESCQRLRDFLKTNETFKKVEQQREEQITTRAGVDYEAIKQELKGSVGRILGFCDFPPDEIQRIQGTLKELREQKTPIDSAMELRRLKKPVVAAYWKAYEKAYAKFHQSRGNVPRFIKLMLNYGFFDDQFLEMEHLVALSSLEDMTRGKPEYPIFSSTGWLDHIASGKEEPSVDDLGQSYLDRMKLEHKEMGWRRETDIPADLNNYDSRSAQELKHFFENNVKLTSGSPITAFPILTKFHIMQDLEKSLVTRERLSQALDQLLAVDYSAFHREIILNDEQRKIFKEFVQVAVIPNMIVLPSIGTKIMMWQELALMRRKDSPGRLAVPVFATGDLFTMLIEAVGAFRWELLKTILGPDWNDISKSSMTSDYMDYIQFYKKNRELSDEVKEKLSAEFKRFRDDRSKFVNDYVQWIKFESQGAMKLNRVVRGIFYRHVPFSKPVRDVLCTQPAFLEFHNRFTNIRKKKLVELENRWKKYGEKDALPSPLRETLRYWAV